MYWPSTSPAESVHCFATLAVSIHSFATLSVWQNLRVFPSAPWFQHPSLCIQLPYPLAGIFRKPEPEQQLQFISGKLAWSRDFVCFEDIYLEDDARFNKKFIIFFASARDRTWFHLPLPLKARSRSSASDNCDAMETSVLDEVASMFSSANILEFLAPGDIFWGKSLQKQIT